MTDQLDPHQLEIAIIVPCFNEEAAIGRVIDDFGKVRDGITVYVYDNASTDSTIEVARKHGAVVRSEPTRGKGNVVRRMFADIDADIFVMVDGDDTYDPGALGEMIDLLIEDRCDLVTGKRIEQHEDAYRFGHRFGNRLLASITTLLFGRKSVDLLSGYRVMSRRFVKSFPAISSGFEIETELTIHALSLNLPMREVATAYRERPAMSESKLTTYFNLLFLLSHKQRPFLFFSSLALFLALMSLALGIPVTLEFFDTGLVERFPTAILSASIMLLAFLSLTTGMVLDSVARGRRESKRLTYLALNWLKNA